MPELLLPAGSFDSALAAFEGGADAVYFGFKEFSARASARNFSHEEYRRLLQLARDTGKAVYAAINTLIYSQEMREAVSLLAFLSEFPPDALILQDWGLVRLIRQSFPGLTMHASTQMAIQTPDAARLAQERGISRIVMPRETDCTSIKNMIRECPGMEFEVFVHGALCYSYSGFCHASCVLTGRSGNRGECAQICRSWFNRMPYGRKSRNQPNLNTDVRNGMRETFPLNGAGQPCSGEGPGYWFSCKDLDLSERIGELADAGVHSFKIEGRMKGPEYTKSVARLYRNLLSAWENSGLGTSGSRSFSASKLFCSKDHDKAREEVRLTFARAPTEAFFFEKQGQSLIDPVFPGHRGILAGEILDVRPFMPVEIARDRSSVSTIQRPDNQFSGMSWKTDDRRNFQNDRYMPTAREGNTTQWLLEVKLETDLGLKDGLMLEASLPPAEPIRFSCSRILDVHSELDKNRARAGETVLILAPEKAMKGQHVFRISARYLDLKKTAPEEFEPARLMIPVVVEVVDGTLRLKNIPSRELPGFSFLYESSSLPLAPGNRPGGFGKALTVFSECKDLEFKLTASFSEKPATGPGLPPEGMPLCNVFLPPSLLKMERNVIYERVLEALAVWRDARVTDALEKSISASPLFLSVQARTIKEKGFDSASSVGVAQKILGTVDGYFALDDQLPLRSLLNLPRPGVTRGIPWVTAPSLERQETLPEAGSFFWLPMMPVVRDWDRYASLIVSFIEKEFELGHNVAIGISSFHHLVLAQKLDLRFSGYSRFNYKGASSRLKFFLDFTMNVANIPAWNELQEAAGIPMPAYPCAEKMDSFIPPLFISKGCLKRHGDKDAGCPPQCSGTWFAHYSSTSTRLVALVEDCISITFLDDSRGQTPKNSTMAKSETDEGLA